MSNSQKLHIPGLMKKKKICKKTIYKYIDRKITMWYSLTCVVSDASNNARVAQWWSVSLPRRRSRVRSPSRAYFFLQKYRPCLQFALYVILWAGPMFLQREVQAPLKPLMK